eukprot:jgi/Botrbrau1/17996/Bobra.0713s0003.1
MVEAVSAVALTSVVIIAAWLGKKLFDYCFEIYKVHSTIQAQFPYPPGSLLVGHATPEIFGSPRPYLAFTELFKKYGKTIACRVLQKPMVLTCDPKLIAAVLERSLDGTTFDKPEYGKHLNIGNPDPSRDNLVAVPSRDPSWKMLRKGTAPAFNPANLRKEFPSTVASALQLVDSIKARQGTEVDLDRAAQRQAMDVIGRVGFGFHFEATGDLSGNAGNFVADPFDCLDAALGEAQYNE